MIVSDIGNREYIVGQRNITRSRKLKGKTNFLNEFIEGKSTLTVKLGPIDFSTKDIASKHLRAFEIIAKSDALKALYISGDVGQYEKQIAGILANACKIEVSGIDIPKKLKKRLSKIEPPKVEKITTEKIEYKISDQWIQYAEHFDKDFYVLALGPEDKKFNKSYQYESYGGKRLLVFADEYQVHNILNPPNDEIAKEFNLTPIGDVDDNLYDQT